MRGLLLVGLAATVAIALLRHPTASLPRSARTPSTRPAPAAGGLRSVEENGDARAGNLSEDRSRVLDDETGAPIAGARVTYYRAWTGEATETVVTDDQGSFAPPDDIGADALVVRTDGYPLSPFQVHRDEKDLRLGRGTTQTFAIVDEDGNPGAYAQVDVCWGYELRLRLYTEAADARGTVTLWLAGSERLLVRLEGYAYKEAEGQKIVLQRGYTIGGKVVDSVGRPVGGARVHVSQGGGG